MKSVVIFGLGYIGPLTSGLILSKGTHVYEVDTNQDTLDVINRGEINNAEPNLITLIVAHDKFKSLYFGGKKVVLDFCRIKKQ